MCKMQQEIAIPCPSRNGNARKKSWNGSANNNRGYSAVKSDKDKNLNVPFHDYDSSSDEEMFRKPFSDHHQ